LSKCGSTLVDIDLTDACTDASLLSVAAHCPNITTVDVHWNRSVTDAGVVALAAACPDLRQLDLYWTRIGDASLSSLAEHPALRRIAVPVFVSAIQIGAIHARRAELGLRALIT
jgi:hypothetical protein